MNTLYEILEVSENASKEVIEKAYKVLAKKYHPDLQLPENKQMAEQKMKQINDAYDILSDDVKRQAYDERLKEQRRTENKETESQATVRGQSFETEAPYASPRQQEIFKQQQNPYYSYGQQTISQQEQRYRDMQRRKYEQELQKQQDQMRKQMEQNMQKQYENAYYNYLRSLGYKIKERWTWKKTKQLLLAILVMIGIIIILWLFPPTHNMIVEFYENNKLVKIIVDIVLGTIIAIFQTIGELFNDLFK